MLNPLKLLTKRFKKTPVKRRMDSPIPTSGSQHVRRINQEAILQVVRQDGPVSRSDVARRLGLNPSTVNRLVEQLAEGGLLREEGEQSAGRQGGRPARLITFNGDAGHIIALDLSNRPWRAALANLNGEIAARFEADPTTGDAQANLARLAELLQDILAEHGRLNGPPLRGIGVGAPSITLWESGTVVWAAGLGWRDLPLKAWLEERCQLPAFVENDVNLLALGESGYGAGQAVENLVVMAVGTGIGAGLLLNGRLYRGASEAAGEIGYLPPDRTALGRDYPAFGPLETLASGPGLVERALLARSQPSELWQLAPDDPPTAAQIYQAARRGDALARSLLAETTDYLSMAVASLSAVLNPDLILLGGEMIHAGDLLLEPMRQRLVGLLPAMPRLEMAQLGADGVILGAVSLVLHNTQAEVAGVKIAWP